MRIPKRVNAVLDWMEQHFVALGVVVTLVVVALVATLAPTAVGFPVAGFILGVAVGGFLVHIRMSRRLARARADNDNLLRENGALRHRNTVLASGVITREAQETQALVAIPEDDLLEDDLRAGLGADPQRTATLDELLGGDPQTTDELPGELPGGEPGKPSAGAPAPALPAPPDGDPQRTTVLPRPPDDSAADEDGEDGEADEDTAKTPRTAKSKETAKKTTARKRTRKT